MKGFITAALSLLLVTFAFHGIAEAAGEGHIELTTISEVEQTIINEKGEKEVTRVAAVKVIPGDTVIYTISYRNTSDEVTEAIVITDPVPEYTTYVGGSAEGEGMSITFSIDGGKTYSAPDNLKITGSDGKERSAMPDEYTNIRWAMQKNLQPGIEGNVSFKTRLD